VNPGASIFRAAVEPRYWVNYRTKERRHSPGDRAAAFCGLANPASFWATLKSLQIEPVLQWSFGDHHRYRYRQLRLLTAQARMHGSTVLLTTEKDIMNMPKGVTEWLTETGVDLYWLQIGVQVANEEDLIHLIQCKARSPVGKS
jgi:tetraacyldisaccharide-1-P 4'-kinase